MHHALNILGWYENWGDDAPPINIWHDPKAIAQHFETVLEKRKTSRGDGDKESVPDDREMVDNDLYKDL